MRLGATLGGQWVTPHLRRVLDTQIEGADQFFRSYGQLVPTMWKSFHAALRNFAAETRSEQVIVQSAVSTFRSLRGWLEQASAIHAAGARHV